MILSRKKRYLQIAFNSTLAEARSIIASLPVSDRLLLEAGTPLIKRYGIEAIRELVRFGRQVSPDHLPYIVADMKTMDRADTEVTMVKEAGASAIICLGQSPVETINRMIETCRTVGMDSMLDMMNVPYPVNVLRQLKRAPDVVILHRGVDEETFNKSKPIPYLQINKVLSTYNVLISMAGGDTIREVQRAIFNGAHIVVVWKEFYQSSANTGKLAEDFLKEIK